MTGLELGGSEWVSPLIPGGHLANCLASSDQIALPDFNAGAMENWGLVTYRENALLYDPQSSSSSNKERVVTVIAHELAHQVSPHHGERRPRTWGVQAEMAQVVSLSLEAEKGGGIPPGQGVRGGVRMKSVKPPAQDWSVGSTRQRIAPTPLVTGRSAWFAGLTPPPYSGLGTW